MKRLLLIGILLCSGVFYAFSQVTTLEQAIRDSAMYISRSLPKMTRIAVLNFTSPSVIMSDHVLEELNDALVNDGSLTVLDRRNLGALQQEMNFQLSGYVSDETQQAIGKMLGAEMIVSGSLGVWGNEYQRFRVQVLIVETGALKYSEAQTIRHDYVVETLLTGKAPDRDFTTGERAATIALNLFFGMGSFTVQKDIKTGVLVLVTEVVGLGIAAVFGVLPYYAVEKGFGEVTGPQEEFRKYTTLFLAGGIGTCSLGMIIAAIRVMNYQKPGSFVALQNPGPWNIAMVPDGRGNPAVQLSYSIQF